MQFLTIVILALSAFSTKAEVFTAMADMETLLGAEKQVTSVIDQYIDVEMKRLHRLKEFATEYQERNQEAIKDGTKHIANPVNAYLLIKRLTSDWDFVEKLMRNNRADSFIANITESRQQRNVVFPDSEDLNGAALALLRLQDTYRLATSDVAKGKIQGVKRADELTGHDCFELGRIAYNQGDYYHCLMWMQEAKSRAENEEPATVAESELLEYLAFCLYQQGNIKRALAMTRRLAQIAPDHPRAAGNVKWYEDEMKESGIKPDIADLPPISNPRKDDGYVGERDTYEALCRGEVILSEKTIAKLYCYYKMDRPYLRVAPIKVEIIHFNPMAVIFRGVVTDHEISVIKKLATPKLDRGGVIDAKTNSVRQLKRALVERVTNGHLQLIPATNRVAKTAWLKGEEHPVIKRIFARADHMTNLNMETSEDLQISNYGLGGHYDPHFDHARIGNYGLAGHYDPHYDMSLRGEDDPYQNGKGNRIATILYYLSTPDAGGATVFVEENAAVFPTINDALFWYNLHRNGEGDSRTRHAACPVLAGTKWVANFWIHERGQEFTRPCALRPSSDETYVGEL